MGPDQAWEEGMGLEWEAWWGTRTGAQAERSLCVACYLLGVVRGKDAGFPGASNTPSCHEC